MRNGKKLSALLLSPAAFALLFAACSAAAVVPSAFFALPAQAAEVDGYVDRGYDFTQMKRLYVWPAECGDIPQNVRLSLPNLIEDWTNGVLSDTKRMRFVTHVKPTGQMWKDLQFIKGPQDFDDPFESDESAGLFFSLLGEACEGVLKTSVSATQTRRWQEPRVETYQTTERVKKTERRRKRDGGWEQVETWIDMPVTKERVIPGCWLTDTLAVCEAELYDARMPGGKYVAASRAEAQDTRESDEAAQAAKDTAGDALRSALKQIFHK